MCTWIIAAPGGLARAARSRPARRAWSGSCGQSSLAVSAPVGATVISSWSVGSAHAAMLADVSDCDRPVDPHRKIVPMRAVVQRVLQASVTVDGKVVGAIDGPGLLVLLGVTHDDGPGQVAWMARKIWDLRHAARGAVRLRRRARRSSWSASSRCTATPARAGGPPGTPPRPGEVSEPVYEQVCAELERLGATVARGRVRRGHAGEPGQRRAGDAGAGRTRLTGLRSAAVAVLAATTLVDDAGPPDARWVDAACADARSTTRREHPAPRRRPARSTRTCVLLGSLACFDATPGERTRE